MKRNYNAFIILSVIIIVVLSVIVYLFFQSGSKIPDKTNVTVKESPTQKKDIVTPNSDLLSEWKIYQNQKYNYQFKYPPGLKLSDQSEEYVAVSYMGEKQKASGRTQTELFDGYAFNVANVTEFGYGDLDDFFIQRVNQLKDICSKIGDPRETTIRGKRAITHKLSCLGDYDAYYVLNEDQYFEISLLYVGDDEDLPKYTETINQVFSTFKFTK